MFINGVAFTLVADDNLIKYEDRASIMHLLTSLQERYPLKFDWSPCQYLGIDIAFDKRKRAVKLSIPGYITKMPHRFDPDGLGLAASPCINVSPSKVSSLLKWLKNISHTLLMIRVRLEYKKLLVLYCTTPELLTPPSLLLSTCYLSNNSLLQKILSKQFNVS